VTGSSGGDRAAERRGLTAVLVGLLPVLVAGGIALALVARRESAAVAAAAETAAAVAASALDARVDALRARLDALAAERDLPAAEGQARLVHALGQEPAFGALFRIAPDGTPIGTAPPVSVLEGRAFAISAPLPAGGRLVASLAADAMLAPLRAHVEEAPRGAPLPGGTRLLLVSEETPPADDALVAERSLETEGWRVRVEVPRAALAARIRPRLIGGLLALIAAGAAGVAAAAALFERRRARGTAGPARPGAAPVDAGPLAAQPVSFGRDDDVTTRALLHDLATAITLAASEARRLADGEAGALEPRQADLARQLASRIDGMSRLLRGAMVEAGSAAGPEADRPDLPADRGPSSLADLAADGVEAASALAARRQVDLRFEPPTADDGPLVGYWDADGLRRVIANLVHNAIKYTPAGGGVRVSVRRDGRAALLRVQDSGAGLVPGEIEAVFDAGRRGSAATRMATPGLGLGLATCRAIVSAHGGRVWLESEGPGKGALASVRLPLDRRRAPRGHGRWPARIDWGSGQEIEATVETLSRSGAAVRLSVAPPVGALVALRITGLPGEGPGAATDDEVAALGRVVRILEEGHPTEREGRPAGAPDARAPIAAIAFAEVGPGTGARLERAVAAVSGVRTAAAGEGGGATGA
jgi:signal transduction histidine kinase